MLNPTTIKPLDKVSPNPCSQMQHPAWIDKLSEKHRNFLIKSLEALENLANVQKGEFADILAQKPIAEITKFLKNNIYIGIRMYAHMEQCITEVRLLSNNQIEQKSSDDDITIEKVNRSIAPFSLSDCVEKSPYSDQYYIKLNSAITFDKSDSGWRLQLLSFIASNSETLKNALYANEILNGVCPTQIYFPNLIEEEFSATILNKTPEHQSIITPVAEIDDEKKYSDELNSKHNNCLTLSIPRAADEKIDGKLLFDKFIKYLLPKITYNELISENHELTLANARETFGFTLHQLRLKLPQPRSTAKYIKYYINNVTDLPLYKALRASKITVGQYRYLVNILFVRAYIKEFGLSAFIKDDTGAFIFDAIGFSNYLKGKQLAFLVPYIINTKKNVNKTSNWIVDKEQPILKQIAITVRLSESISTFDEKDILTKLAFEFNGLILDKIGVEDNLPRTKITTTQYHILMRGLMIEFVIMALKLKPDIDNIECERLANGVFNKLAEKYKFPNVNMSGVVFTLLNLTKKNNTSIKNAIYTLEQMRDTTRGEVTLFNTPISDIPNAFNLILHHYTLCNRNAFAEQHKIPPTEAFINFIYTIMPSLIENIAILQYTKLVLNERPNSKLVDFSERSPSPRRFKVPLRDIMTAITNSEETFGSNSLKKRGSSKIGLVEIPDKHDLLDKLLGNPPQTNHAQIEREFGPEDKVKEYLTGKLAEQYPEVSMQLKDILSFQVKISEVYENVDVSPKIRAFSVYRDEITQESIVYRLVELIDDKSTSKKLTLKQIKQILIQLVDIIKLLYIAKISHRDLHAGNIKVIFTDNGDPIVKIFDFGTAQVDSSCFNIEADIRYLFLQAGVTQDRDMFNYIEGLARIFIDAPKHYPFHRLLMNLGFSKKHAKELLEQVGIQLLKELTNIKTAGIENTKSLEIEEVKFVEEDTKLPEIEKISSDKREEMIEQAFDNCKQTLITQCAIYTNSVLDDIDPTKQLSKLKQKNIKELHDYLNSMTQKQPEQLTFIVELLCILKNCANNNIELKPHDLLTFFEGLLPDELFTTLEQEIANKGNDFTQLVDNFSVSELRKFVDNEEIYQSGRQFLEKILLKDVCALTINSIKIATMQHMDSEDLVLTIFIAKGVYRELSNGSNYVPPSWLVSYINQKYRPGLDANTVTLIEAKQVRAIMEHISESSRKDLANVLNGGTFDLGTMFSCLGWETDLENPDKLNYKMIPPLLLNLTDPLAKNMALMKKCEIGKLPFHPCYLGGEINFGKLERAYLDYLENKEQIDNILEGIRLVATLDNFAIKTERVARNKIGISPVNIN